MFSTVHPPREMVFNGLCFQLVSRLNQNSDLCLIYVVIGLWLEQEGCPDMGYTKLIAVHAGLLSSKPVDTQLQTLRERNATTSRIEQLAGRKNVWKTPPVSLSFNPLLLFPSTDMLEVAFWGENSAVPKLQLVYKISFCSS
jgi:hypothetical protein